MDQPFQMQPQRRPPGIFGAPPVGGAEPVSFVRRFTGGPFAKSSPAPSPATVAAPAPGAPSPFTAPRPNVPVESGPYNYSGPSMNLLKMTDAAPNAAPVTPAAPAGVGDAGRPFGGGNFLNGVFSGRPRMVMA